MEAAPIIVHARHCRWCQRGTGSAFAHNAMVERSRVTLLQGELETVPVPSGSGRGQKKIVRCARCHVALRSRYPGGGEIAFVRAGTLTSPSLAPPDLRIHGALKQPWLALPSDARAVDAFYDPRVEWLTEAPQRYRVAEQSGRSNPPFPARPMATPGAADARTG